ncbi:MAG: tyrosinase family protein [Cyclobacteriaceae bacterium]|nr:tyrosinase family protein [Cyclobacteriaceae bacterium]
MKTTRRDFIIKSGMAGLVPLLIPEELFSFNQPAIVTRRDVNQPNAANDLATYVRGVTLLKNLPANDARNWENLALIHVNFCPHGNWYFLPWHRAYLQCLEKIIRDVTATPTFALPYWDWTTNRSIPAPFWNGTLMDATREVTQVSKLPDESVGKAKVMDGIFKETVFELFGSFMPRNQNSIDPSWQRGRGTKSTLEHTPHDDVHVWISGNMGAMFSPRDPIFWLHHCNIDRVWADWNSRGRSNSNNAFWKTFVFRGNFVDPQSAKYDVTVGDMESTTALGYTYPNINPVAAEVIASSTDFMSMAFSRKFAFTQLTTATLQEDGLLSVPITKSAVAEANTLKLNTPKQRRILAIVKNVTPPADPNVRVRVFMNCPYLKPTTPADDAHYVGSLSFFAAAHVDHNQHGGGQAEGFSYVFDLTNTISKLNQAKAGIVAEQIDIQLIPVPLENNKAVAESAEIKFDGAEIVFL